MPLSTHHIDNCSDRHKCVLASAAGSTLRRTGRSRDARWGVDRRYESAALGRRGSIEFKLKAGTNEARGDVLMVPRGSGTPYQSRPSHDPLPPPTTPSFELLTIRFIRASNGSIGGRLDRYWDPDRNCFANTAFNGYVGLGIVEGTFKTTFECGAGEATGTWNASKKPAKPGEARR